ncbi:MAG: hypothetical protein ACRDY0_11485 [Acidimicrobiales bacterium]
MRAGRVPVTDAVGRVADAVGRDALEEERDFLLRSLHDLEAERAAGDIDELDYRSLRDGYTSRAAAVLRRLDGHGPGGDGLDIGGDERRGLGPAPSGGDPAVRDGPAGPDGAVPVLGQGPRSGGRRRARRLPRAVVLAAGVIVVAGSAGWTVGHLHRGSAAPLAAGAVERLLVQGQREAGTNPVAALAAFRSVLASYPDQPQALTDEGWVLAQAGVVGPGQADLERAEQVAPGYDLPHAYLGYLLGDQGDLAGAVTQLRFYLDHNPSPALASQAQAALAAAEAQLATKAGGPAPG